MGALHAAVNTSLTRRSVGKLMFWHGENMLLDMISFKKSDKISRNSIFTKQFFLYNSIKDIFDEALLQSLFTLILCQSR